MNIIIFELDYLRMERQYEKLDLEALRKYEYSIFTAKIFI
jgi:hypothetical protein